MSTPTILSTNKVLDIVASAIRQEEEIKGIRIKREEIKQSGTGYLIVYRENTK